MPTVSQLGTPRVSSLWNQGHRSGSLEFNQSLWQRENQVLAGLQWATLIAPSWKWKNATTNWPGQYSPPRNQELQSYHVTRNEESWKVLANSTDDCPNCWHKVAIIPAVVISIQKEQKPQVVKSWLPLQWLPQSSLRLPCFIIIPFHTQLTQKRKPMSPLASLSIALQLPLTSMDLTYLQQETKDFN